MSLEEAVPGNLPIDGEKLGTLMDGRGELAGALAASDFLARRLLDQLRFQFEVLAEIYDLSDPASKTPLHDRDLIRIKSAVAIRQAEKSGLLA